MLPHHETYTYTPSNTHHHGFDGAAGNDAHAAGVLPADGA